MTSWADIVTVDKLDDSRDGLNLMIKQTLSVGKKQVQTDQNQQTQSISETLRQVQESVKPKKKKSLVGNTVAKATTKSEPSPWKAALMSSKQKTVTSPIVDQFSTTNNGFTSRKRLACEITKTPKQKKEKDVKMKDVIPEEETNEKKDVLPFSIDFKKSEKNDNKSEESENEKSETKSDVDEDENDKLPKDKTSERDEKRRKKNPEVEEKIKKTKAKTATPFQIKRLKSWADDESESSEDEEEEEELLEPSTRKTEEEPSTDSKTTEDEKDSTEGSQSGLFPKQPIEDLTEARIEKRQRQIDIGKATDGYQNYTKKIKKQDRKPNSIRYPRTPDKREHISKRAWDARIRRWRRQLHLWDPPGAEASPRKTPFKQGSAPNSSSKSNRKRKPNPSSTIKKSKPVDISNSEQFPSL